MEIRHQTQRELESQSPASQQYGKGFEKKASYVRDCTYKVIPGCILILMIFSIGAVMVCALSYDVPVPREGVVVVAILFWSLFALFCMGLLKIYHDEHYTHFPRRDIFKKPIGWAQRARNLCGGRGSVRPGFGFMSSMRERVGTRRSETAQPAPAEGLPVSLAPAAQAPHQIVAQRCSQARPKSLPIDQRARRSHSAGHTPPGFYEKGERQVEHGAKVADNPFHGEQGVHRRVQSDNISSLSSQTRPYALKIGEALLTRETSSDNELDNDPESRFLPLPQIRLPDDFYELAYKVEGTSEAVDELDLKHNTSEDTDEDGSIMKGFNGHTSLPIQKVNVHRPDTRVNKLPSYHAIQFDPTPPSSRHASACLGGADGASTRTDLVLATKPELRPRSNSTPPPERSHALGGCQGCQNCSRLHLPKTRRGADPGSAMGKSGVRLVTSINSSDLDNESSKGSDAPRTISSMTSIFDEPSPAARANLKGVESVESVPHPSSDSNSKGGM